MLELNKVMLTGRLTRDPDYRSTGTGRAVARLSLAVNRRSFNRETGGQQDEVAFIDIDAWEKSAEFCKNYLHKGSGVYIEGRLKQDKWQDKETGANRSKLMVVAERIQFAESKAEAERQGAAVGAGARGGDEGGVSAPPSHEEGESSTSDDLPF
jgi:single-strand DNA-binding protein